MPSAIRTFFAAHLLTLCSTALGQPPGAITKIHHVADPDRTAAFYRALGLPQRNSATFSIPGESFTLELIKSGSRDLALARMQDIGATRLVLSVRDIDQSLAIAKKAGAEIMTPGGELVPFRTPPGVTRGISVRDPGGYIVELVQFDPPATTTAPASSPVVGGRISTTVGDVEKTAGFYRSLGFEIKPPSALNANENVMKMFDIPAAAKWRYAMANLPNSSTQWEFAEFQLADRKQFRNAAPPAFTITIPAKPPAAEVRDPDGNLLRLIAPK